MHYPIRNLQSTCLCKLKATTLIKVIYIQREFNVHYFLVSQQSSCFHFEWIVDSIHSSGAFLLIHNLILSFNLWWDPQKTKTKPGEHESNSDLRTKIDKNKRNQEPVVTLFYMNFFISSLFKFIQRRLISYQYLFTIENMIPPIYLQTKYKLNQP